MSSREYAENLIGGWDRSGYAKQGDVAKQTAKTKWEVLQNQFANLKAQLESQREEAQQNFSEGLGAVAEGSYDRMNKGTADLVNRGLTNSGIGNLITQADTRAKGTDVRGLLDTLGNVMTQNADKLKQGGDQLHQQGMANNQNLGEALGALSNRDMESQMTYNKGAANIAEAKEARDAENRLQAMQRARSGGGGSGGKSKEESDAEDFYKKLAINEIIADPTMTRQQKSNLLKVGFDIADPDSLLGDRGAFGKPLKVDDGKKRDLFGRVAPESAIYGNGLEALSGLFGGFGDKVQQTRDYTRTSSDPTTSKVENSKVLKGLQSLLEDTYGKARWFSN